MNVKGRSTTVLHSVVKERFLLFLFLLVTLWVYAQSPSRSGAATPAALEKRSEYQAAYQLFLRGRQAEIAGKEAEAAKAFTASLQGAERLLASDPLNNDYISLQCWNLFRLERHDEVVAAAQKALRAAQDYRIVETLAESLYFLGRTEESLRYFSQYFQSAPENDERMSSAYYYVGECYVRLKKYEHADIAFSTATTLEKNMYYWWYRLGTVKEILSQYRRAYEAYARSLKISPRFQNALDGQARVKAKAGL
jgi:tetratricopeptide (TPR) repeat protein